MVEITEAWMPVVNALIGAPVAWRTPAELAGALERDVEETTDVLCLLDVEGWVEVWDCEAGPLVTLSPLAAERLHVHLVEIGPDETPRWARVGDPVPPPPKARYVCFSERAAALDLVPDPAPAPDLAAEQAECGALDPSTEGDSPARPAATLELPRPTVLIGLGLAPWPGPPGSGATHCPACRGNPLAPTRYCLYCDRWGLDHLLASLSSPARRPALKPKPTLAPRERAEADRLRHDHERARRKAKRQRRHQVKLEEEALRHRTRPLKTSDTQPTPPPRHEPRAHRKDRKHPPAGCHAPIPPPVRGFHEAPVGLLRRERAPSSRPKHGVAPGTQ